MYPPFQTLSSIGHTSACGRGAPVDHGEVVAAGLAAELVEDVGAGAEEVGVRHGPGQVDAGVGAPVGRAV